MKITYNLWARAVMLTLLPLLAMSCIKLDTSDCYGGNTIVQFSYGYDVGDGGVAPGEIESIAFYMFDSGTGLFAGSFVIEPSFAETASSNGLTKEYQYSHSLSIPPGDYDLIAWVNQCCSTKGEPRYISNPRFADFVVGQTKRSDVTMYLNCEGGQKVEAANLKPLMYGEAEAQQIIRNESQTVRMELRPYSNIMKITVTGLTGLTAGDRFDYCICDNNSTHYFRQHWHNAVVQPNSDEVSYRADAYVGQNGELSGQMTLLRLWDRAGVTGKTRANDQNARLTIKRMSDEKVYLDKKDVIEMVLDAVRKDTGIAPAEFSFDKRYMYHLVLEFNANLEMTVSLRDWNYIPNPGPI